MQPLPLDDSDAFIVVLLFNGSSILCSSKGKFGLLSVEFSMIVNCLCKSRLTLSKERRRRFPNDGSCLPDGAGQYAG